MEIGGGRLEHDGGTLGDSLGRRGLVESDWGRLRQLGGRQVVRNGGRRVVGRGRLGWLDVCRL